MQEINREQEAENRPACTKGHLLDAEVTMMAAWRGEEDAIWVCLS